ncbi:hypothetical protein Sj15T_09570 [Sphingobium sp. TA15]|nr:hypothetical protein Sj15T_09570 [Sphingobium sp. TA15]
MLNQKLRPKGIPSRFRTVENRSNAGTATAYEQGEAMTILRTGGVLGWFDGSTRWAEVNKGRLLPPDLDGRGR